MSVKINREETNLEILARIAKAAARKYDCTLTIDFRDGNRRIAFCGDSTAKQKIADTLETYFRGTSEEGPEERSAPPEGGSLARSPSRTP